MRTLTSTLLAAQRARASTPHLAITITNRKAGVRQLRWEPYQTTTTTGPHAAAISQNGALHRLRIDTATNTLHRQSVPPASQTVNNAAWHSWTSFRTNTLLCALAQWGANLLALAVDSTNPTQVHESLSPDNGATWTAFTLAITHTESISHVAAAAKADGTVVAVVTGATTVTAYKRSPDATWGSPVHVAGGADLATKRGVAVHHRGDWNILVAAQDAATGNAVLARFVFGDGFTRAVNTWGSRLDIQTASATSATTYSYPALHNPDVHRCTFRETYTGTGAYDRTMHSYQPLAADFPPDTWREPLPLDITSDHGLAITTDGVNAVWLTSAGLAYRAPLALTTLDVTDDVIEAHIYESEYSTRPAVIILDNSHGKYDTPGLAPVAALQLGADVEIAPGYRTTAGNETSTLGHHTITALTHVYNDAGQAHLRIEARPLFHLLHEFTPTRLYTRTNVNGFQPAATIAGRAGVALSSLSSSSAFTNLNISLLLLPGVSGLTALQQLLQRYTDRLLARGPQLLVIDPLPGAPSEASYHVNNPNEHPIIAASYTKRAPVAAWYQAHGQSGDNPVLGEHIDFDALGHTTASALQAIDHALTTEADADARALAMHRTAQIATNADQLIAPVHAGLELHDIIAITDPRLNLTAAKRRVTALELHYTRSRSATYRHLITLGQT